MYLYRGCSDAVTDPAGAFWVAMPALPTAPGTYALIGEAILGTSDTTGIDPHLSGSLTVFRAKSLLASSVSAVPEPKSILLLGSIFGAVGWRLRPRLA